MSSPFTIKSNDTRPALVWEVTTPIESLTGATIVFNMRNKVGELVINRAPATFTQNEGELTKLIYVWTAIDTATAGDKTGEFEITFPDGFVETHPNSTSFPIKIVQDLG